MDLMVRRPPYPSDRKTRTPLPLFPTRSRLVAIGIDPTAGRPVASPSRTAPLPKTGNHRPYRSEQEKRPSFGRKAGARRSARGFGSFRNGALSLPAVACVLLFDATRCATITETRCERVLFPRPYRPPQPCRTACRLRSGTMAGPGHSALTSASLPE
jgi:hypothetical protein